MVGELTIGSDSFQLMEIVQSEREGESILDKHTDRQHITEIE